jgi:catechol 2,3-dioxygenase-like lactoylglutathione lyase family enzyme
MMIPYAEEDLGNIISLEHVNVQIPDQAAATLFYVVGMGFTRDPYLNVGLNNMWVNVGEQQFHLPTREPQVIDGHVGLVVPDLDALEKRLEAIAPSLKDSRFGFSRRADHLAVTSACGNHYRCFTSQPGFGDMTLGMPYVEFAVAPGATAGILRFYETVLGAPVKVESDAEGKFGRVEIGCHQALKFREVDRPLAPYDGHHIAIYVANFSRPYGFLRGRELISEDVRNHQFRFKDIVDPEDGKVKFTVEHEVRSLRHPMYHRPFVNRNATQSQRGYRRGWDGYTPFRP